jgi:serine/threonine protein kinase
MSIAKSGNLAASLKSFLTAKPQETIEDLEEHSVEEFKSKYTKVQRLGQGSAGSAWLVKKNDSQKKFVSKKIVLDGKSEKEILGCMNEVNLLKNL